MLWTSQRPAKQAMRRFYAVYASAEMMKVLPEPGCNDPVRAQSVVRSSQARGGSPAHAGRVRPAACSLCMGLRSAWSLHIQIRPSSDSGSGICNRARWRGCVSYFTLATFSGRAAATRPREGPMVRIHLPPAASQQRTARQRSAASSERLLRAPPSSASQPKSAGASADNSTNRAGSPPAIAALRSTVY